MHPGILWGDCLLLAHCCPVYLVYYLWHPTTYYTASRVYVCCWCVGVLVLTMFPSDRAAESGRSTLLPSYDIPAELRAPVLTHLALLAPWSLIPQKPQYCSCTGIPRWYSIVVQYIWCNYLLLRIIRSGPRRQDSVSRRNFVLSCSYRYHVGVLVCLVRMAWWYLDWDDWFIRTYVCTDWLVPLIRPLIR